MKIWIYPRDGSQRVSIENPQPNNYYEITPYITNEVDQQKRCDDAFAVTTFKAILPSSLFNLVKYNIAPFTVFEIAPNNEAIYNSNNKRYFGYSKCSKYLRPQKDGETYYVHDITLLDLTAILEAIQIGSKTFTTRGEITFTNQLLTIIENTTGIHIEKVGTWELDIDNTFNYSYDKGTTAYEILTEMFKMQNWKIILTYDDSYPEYPYMFRFNLDHIVLSSIPTININENYLTLAEYNQNNDDYCSSLESQVDNVVDRNSTTVYSDLMVKSDDNTIQADNCYLELPTKIESLDKLEVYLNLTQKIWISISIADLEALEAVGDYHDYYYWVTWEQIINQCSWVADLVDHNNPNAKVEDRIYKCSRGVVSGTTTPIGILIYDDGGSNGWYDITRMCLDESIYMSLTPHDQPEHCYYSSGSNRIDGLYKYYKDGWIYNLVGATNEPLLNHLGEQYDYINESTTVIAVDNNENVYGNLHYWVTNEVNQGNTGDDPTKAKFRVTATPITNQYVKDRKVSELNSLQNSYIARSYGNSANYIDYDAMKKNISIANKSLGTPELTLQFFDNCNLTENSKFTYDDTTWYVMSIVMQVTREHIVYTVNASTDYNKQADCIGVKTQYQATKIALDNIKERHLYFTDDETDSYSKTNTYYIDITFIYKDGTTKEFMMPCSIYANENTGVTLVTSFVDNYSAGKTYGVNENNGVLVDSNRYILQDLKYCDDDGEIYSIKSMKIVHYNTELTMDEARKLPRVPSVHSYAPDVVVLPNLTNGTAEQILSRAIYKDEHEQLVITIYMPNATYIEE